MKRAFAIIVSFIGVAVICITSCVHKPQLAVTPANGDYPAPVAAIILNKCTYAGCHNSASYQNAAGIELDTWAHMFNGGVSGAEVVAYSPAYSPLLYYCNVDSALGVVAKDAGHLDTPLTKAEYLTLSNWVAAGAPDAGGNIPFASDPDTRNKVYLVNQGCDLIAVIDAKSKLVMRYIPVGMDGGNPQSPHDVVVSSDGLYAYTSLYLGSYVQKIDTRIDTVISNVNLGSVALGGGGSWSIIYLSPEDTSFMVTGWQSDGNVVAVNTSAMTVNEHLSVDNYTGGTSYFTYPHGITGNATYDTFFVALQYGNVVVKYTFNGSFWYKYVSINGQPPSVSNNANDTTDPNPHFLLMSPDNSRYFVTCQSTNQVVVMDAHTDTVIASIPVGTFPQEMDISPSRNYLFVTCQEDASNPQVGRHGSVYVINYNTLQVVTVLYGDFYQPHGITVDEQDGFVFVPSRNVNPNGPAPHHTSACGGRDGWYSVYNLNTLQPADNNRYEVTADPYSSAVRFK